MRLNSTLNEMTGRRLNKAVALTGLRRAEIVRRALDEWFDRHDMPKCAPGEHAPRAAEHVDVYLLSEDPDMMLRVAADLREAKFRVGTPEPGVAYPTAQQKVGIRAQPAYWVDLGEERTKNGLAGVKRSHGGEWIDVDLDRLGKYLWKMMSNRGKN